MQGKGLIRFSAVFLIVVCIYQLLFTWKVNQVEKGAIQYSERSISSEDASALFPDDLRMQSLYNDSISELRRIVKNRYLDSVSSEKVFNLLVTQYTYRECKERQLNLGLDLQGGMSVVLQVSLKELLISMSDNSTDKNFLKALDLAEEKQSSSTSDFITLFYESFKEIAPGSRLAPVFATRDYKDVIPFAATDQEVLKVIREEAESAIRRTFNIISSRIDQFGVTQPNLTLEPSRGRIIVELAGVDNPTRVRKLLQATASLEFWETYKVSEIGGYLNDANTAIREHLELQSFKNGASELSATPTLLSTDSKEDTTKSLLDKISAATEDTAADGESSEFSMEEFQQENPLFSVLQPNINSSNQYVESPIVGFARARDTATINSYLRLETVTDIFPRELSFKWGAKPFDKDNPYFSLYAIKKLINDDRPPLDGSAVVAARQDIGQTGEIIVEMRMNSEGAAIWKKLTGQNVNRHIAVVLDDVVYSAPIVNQEIGGGTSQISGGFTIQEAQDLANILKTGKLPARAQIIEENIVGPSLGKESVAAGMRSLIMAFLIVMGFMVLYYAGGGIISDLVLLFNVLLIFGVLAALGATLTLPGMAGIVLTIGMAVDANVIIFERIREEILKGKVLKLAIADGYKNSYSAIIDGNVTTLITAIILAWVGMGPVLGFATILIIGILSSLFTAVLVSRMLVDTWVEKGKDIKFSTPISEKIFSGFNMDFLGMRKLVYIISGTMISIAIASMVFKGFQLGVDFKGGRDYQIQMESSANTTQIKSSLDNVFGTGTVVKTIGSSNKIKVSTAYKIGEKGEAADRAVDSTLFTGLKPFYNENLTFEMFRSQNILSSLKVDPTISVDIKKSSIIAILLSLLAISLYILIRFRKWQFSVGAVASIVHDTLFVLGVFSLFSAIMPFSMELDQAFIAAILTVIGYSLNDTVVVFDRIREYLGLYPKKQMNEVVNDAIASTLNRTVITSFTTLMVVAITFVFGGEVIRGFSFALLIGILVGTYSSIFVASTIMFDLTKDKKVETSTTTSSVAKKGARK